MEAEIIRQHDHPLGDYAHGRGSYQALPNGNTFMGWTQSSLHSEYAPDGKLVMEAAMKAELKSYRSYKFPWVGRPMQPPDVYSIALNGQAETTNTAVHVSWNGATEVATWKLYKTERTGRMTELVASTPRTGFETALTYQGFASFVVAEALDRDGKTLGKSEVTRTIPPSDMLSPAVLQEEKWLQDHALVPGGSNSSLPEKTFNEESKMPSKTKTTPNLGNVVLAFVGGFVCCALGGLLSLAIWMYTSRPRAVSWWRSEQLEYEQVSETDEDAKEYEHDSDGYDDKKRVRIRCPAV
jgi:hypothetical protein